MELKDTHCYIHYVTLFHCANSLTLEDVKMCISPASCASIISNCEASSEFILWLGFYILLSASLPV